MAGQLLFFNKSVADFENTTVVLTVTSGSTTIANILNRSSRDAWASEGSSDIISETIIADLGDVRRISSILVLKHNFKHYRVYYWNEDTSAYVLITDSNLVQADTENAYIELATPVNTSKIRIIIDDTLVANEEKTLAQLILTTKIGQLEGWPIIKKPTLSRDGKANKMLSGKFNYQVSAGAYSATLEVANWSSDDDLEIVETLYDINEGFLFWPCGGDAEQFKSIRKGYRYEDIYLCRCSNEYVPELYGGFYQSGMVMKIDLVEVNT